jgi:small subunit ribosomal protein S6
LSENVYEGMFILDSNRYSRDPGAIVAQIPKVVEKFGGEMLASRLWNEQRLAYPIKGQRKGTYWLTYFRLEGDQLSKLNREFRLNDNILRNLVLKIDDRLAGTFVEHAQRGTADAKPSAPEAKAGSTSEKKTEPEKGKQPEKATEPEKGTGGSPAAAEPVVSDADE